MNSPTCETVESELVVETLVQANAGTVHPAGTFEANDVKTEVVRQNLQSIELSTKELLEQKPMKCEPMPLAPQQGCTSDLSVSGGDLSTPSEYSDIATKNANFDLKELNVSSDKVEASVSARIYGYGPKFVQDRYQDRSFGSSRGNFMRGRGKGWGRFHRLRRDWNSGCDFESYGGIADYRFRHNRTAAVWESANERNDYDSRLDGGAFASNRRRNPLNDALHSFRNPPALRLSPNGRKDAAMMGIQMLHSAPRNISPSRCTGENGSVCAGLWHSEKFNRDFPDDTSNPVYSHQQSIYDGPDHHFFQGKTKFTAMQRSGFPRIWSKSPYRSRTWSLPPRRLTEGLNGHQDLSQHRFPVMYWEDRMRSSS
ncbi:hypothetical protein KY284_019627 [Solanum tuberosum]|nr:hypothetical protein KY284_019627 [Solanum tuberosum]